MSAFTDQLASMLKYVTREQLEARKLRFKSILSSPHKPYDQMKLPQDVSNAAIKKWNDNQFTPTQTTPKPSHVALGDNEKKAWLDLLTQHGLTLPSDVGHLHNLAALVAGKIPATAVDKAFLMDHPVGKDLLSKAIAQGHTFFHVKSKHGHQSIVGRPENLSYIKQGLLNGQEHMVLRGLGWPESIIPKPNKESDLPIPFYKEGI